MSWTFLSCTHIRILTPPIHHLDNPTTKPLDDLHSNCLASGYCTSPKPTNTRPFSSQSQSKILMFSSPLLLCIALPPEILSCSLSMEAFWWQSMWMSEGLHFSWHDCLFGGDSKDSSIWSQIYLFAKLSMLLAFSHIYTYIHKIIHESSQNTFSTFIFLSSGDSLWMSFHGVWIFTLHLQPWTFLCQ